MINNLRAKIQTIPDGVKASVAYTICSVFQRCLSFITMPLFTRLLTTEQYGQYNIYQAWSSILSIFLTLNLAYGSFSTAMIKYENDRKGYIAAVQNLCLLIAAVFLVLYYPFRESINQWLELPTPLVFTMVLETLTIFGLSCWYACKRFEYQYKNVVALTILVSVLSPILAFVLVMNSSERGYARIVGYAAVNIIVGGTIFIYSFFAGKGGIKKEYWKYALHFNIPLIPYYLSQVIFNQSDRIMISHISGTDKAGIYSVAYTLSTVLLFVLNAINGSYVPWLYGRIKEGQGRENRSIANGIAGLMAFLLLAVIALAPEIILIMAGKDYYEAIWVVPPVAMSILLLFYSQLFINVEFYYEEKKMLVWGSIGAAVLNIVLNGLLIPRFGYVAAGYTTLVSYVVFAGTNYFTLKFISKKRQVPCDYFDLKALIGIALVFAVLTALATMLYEHQVIRYVIVVLVLIAMAVAHKRIIAFIKRFVLRKT